MRFSLATLALWTATLLPVAASAQVTVQINAPPPPSVVVAPPPTYVPPQAPPVMYAPESEPEVEATMPPPPPQVEALPPAPAPGFAWRRGYWRWAGNQYVWIGGHWEQPPQPGAVWVEPQWGVRRGRWRFTRGRWGAAQPQVVVAPQPVYAPPAPQPVYAPPPPQVYGPGYGRRRGGVVVVQPPGVGVGGVAPPGAVFVRPGRWRRR